jgi:hypothetical protein
LFLFPALFRQLLFLILSCLSSSYLWIRLAKSTPLWSNVRQMNVSESQTKWPISYIQNWECPSHLERSCDEPVPQCWPGKANKKALKDQEEEKKQQQESSKGG